MAFLGRDCRSRRRGICVESRFAKPLDLLLAGPAHDLQ